MLVAINGKPYVLVNPTSVQLAHRLNLCNFQIKIQPLILQCISDEPCTHMWFNQKPYVCRANFANVYFFCPFLSSGTEDNLAAMCQLAHLLMRNMFVRDNLEH